MLRGSALYAHHFTALWGSGQNQGRDDLEANVTQECRGLALHLDGDVVAQAMCDARSSSHCQHSKAASRPTRPRAAT
jgi:hypothetical protein